MITRLEKITPMSLESGAELIKRGELVAFPTETVYGLGADALNGQAVKKIFAAKGRPGDNPLIVHVASKEQMMALGHWNENAEKVFEAFMPGPITMVLKRKNVPDEVTAGLDSVGLRFPEHPDAQRFITLAGPIAAPSANISGKPSPTTAKHVFDDFNGKIPLVLDGGACGVGVESTVISLVDAPILLRPGGITLEQLKVVLPDITVHDAVLANVELDAAASPGMKYKHYAPNARVVIAKRGEKLYNSALEHNIKAVYYKKQEDAEDARMLFARLRQADDDGAQLVIFDMPNKDGIGLSVANRLLRASAFTFIDEGQSLVLQTAEKTVELKG